MFLNKLMHFIVFFDMVSDGLDDRSVICIDFVKSRHDEIKGVIFMHQ